MEIEYLYTEENPNAPMPVRLNKKVVGTIKRVKGGWQYFPLNHKKGGEIFETIGQVQRSLEFVEE